MATDTALWLHNKLGSTDDLWSGKIICSQLSRERLINIQDCFHTLQSHVKVKLLLSFLHIPRRNIEQWQQDLEEIILLGINDPDPWVSTVGDIMREYPSSGALLLVEDANMDSNMAICLQEVKLMAQKCNVNMIPLECQYLNKASLAAVAGQIPESSKHFTIKRRPKSAALRAEIIQKSSETVLNKRNHASSVPIKSRSFAKKMDTSNSNLTPLKMTPGRSPYNSDFRSPTTPLGRMNSISGRSPITPISLASRSSASKKDSKIKLLEIEEMPVGAKEAKRRKKIADMEALEAQKKEKDAMATAAGSNQPVTTTSVTAATTISYTPDYAAGLIPSAAPKMPMTVLSVSNPTLPQPSPAYLPSSVRQNTQNVTIASGLASSLQPTSKSNLSEQLKQQLLQPQTRTTTITASPLPIMTPILIASQQPSSVNSSLQSSAPVSNTMVASATPPPSSHLMSAPMVLASAIPPPSPHLVATSMVRPVMVQQVMRPPSLSNLPPQVLTVTQQPQQSTSQPPQTAAKTTGLSLTKDQMLEAQEMFRVSNKVSRPEKALILGFMAGSRENPCAQRGDILNIKLSEKEEVVLMPDGTKKKKIEDTIFQMNYATGEWKRFLNLREVDIS